MKDWYQDDVKINDIKRQEMRDILCLDVGVAAKTLLHYTKSYVFGDSTGVAFKHINFVNITELNWILYLQLAWK